MLASFCTRLWDVQSFIFCAHAGDRLTSRGRFAPSYPTLHIFHNNNNVSNACTFLALFLSYLVGDCLFVFVCIIVVYCFVWTIFTNVLHS